MNGEDQQPFAGSDTMTSKAGQLFPAFKGTHIDVNSKLLPSGQRVGPNVEYPTWKIRSATGMYQGWRGGGNWASVTYGYKALQQYSVEWDGYITE